MIYIIEDDQSISELVAYTLKMSGYEARCFVCGKDFFEAVERQMPKLALIDIMLPEEDGISILKKIRNRSDIKKLPVILVTAKSSEYDKVVGLDSGADDYITKPFGMMELVSRVKALLRRTDEYSSSDEKISAGDIVINLSRHTVSVNNKNISLTYKEFELLSMLVENKGKVLSRDVVLEHVWGYNYVGETRTIDVHIRSLRLKLGESGNIIETVRGVGYRIGV